MLLLQFLFPTFYTLSSLLEEDHTVGIVDTVIMSGIILFLIVLLATPGGIARWPGLSLSRLIAA